MPRPHSPHCDAASPRCGDDCPCVAAGAYAHTDREAHAHDEAEPFAWTRVRPYMEPPHDVEPPDTVTGPGPVWGIMQGYLSEQPATRETGWNLPETEPPVTPREASAARRPHPMDVPTRPEDASAAAHPSNPSEDDTLTLHPIRHSLAVTHPRDATPGTRRAVNRHRTAAVAGAMTVLAAVAGATALTGGPAGPGGTAQRAVPVVTSASPPDAGPAMTPAAPPAGRQPSPVDGDRPDPRTTTPTVAPPSSPRLAAPAPSDGSASRCTVPHLPGSPCPSSSGPGTASPSRGPVSLCCGADGPEVTALQYRLQFLGLYKAEADGVYSRRVANAVAAYQKLRRITADPSGQYGPATRTALQREVPDLVYY
ncbi:peptidoglycan-binding protein [Streptomyces sp. NPDC090021]|uniref:peptidoglycan-binding domain-containing protein n=1 Tax=Streptomyces sp. NPDC090021 TaxID=3365919 RepID=UPI00381BD978